MTETNITPDTNPKHFVPVHVGLLGHIDAGKTALARKLSEILSTSGLDKHPQSQERGITIDLGFTFFPLEKFMVTLVDAPGHADLIKSVVSGASIIDTALLIIDAKHGPQVQTGEHLLILDQLAISRILVIVNKIDLVPDLNKQKMMSQIQGLLEQTRYGINTPILFVSSKTGEGIDLLKTSLHQILTLIPLQRQLVAPLHYVIDHHFGKRGQGTIVTGTVLKGSASVGDNLTILPLDRSVKVKSIQKWKVAVTEFHAGDRCGVALSGISAEELYRGCFLTNSPEMYQRGQWIRVKVHALSLFKYPCKFGQEITLTHQMRVLSGRIFPYQPIESDEESQRLWLNPSISDQTYYAIIWMEAVEYFQDQDVILLTRLDLSPKELRIMGTAMVQAVETEPVLIYKKKVKRGRIKNAEYTKDTFIVEGLAESKTGASTLLGKRTIQPFGEIISTFGGKGNVEIRRLLEETPQPRENHSIQKGDEVILEMLRSFEIKAYRTYDYLHK